jgi:hypothetical protein
MWSFKENEEGQGTCMAAAGFIFLAKKEEKNIYMYIKGGVFFG